MADFDANGGMNLISIEDGQSVTERPLSCSVTILAKNKIINKFIPMIHINNY